MAPGRFDVVGDVLSAGLQQRVEHSGVAARGVARDGLLDGLAVQPLVRLGRLLARPRGARDQGADELRIVGPDHEHAVVDRLLHISGILFAGMLEACRAQLLVAEGGVRFDSIDQALPEELLVGLLNVLDTDAATLLLDLLDQVPHRARGVQPLVLGDDGLRVLVPLHSRHQADELFVVGAPAGDRLVELAGQEGGPVLQREQHRLEVEAGVALDPGLQRPLPLRLETRADALQVEEIARGQRSDEAVLVGAPALHRPVARVGVHVGGVLRQRQEQLPEVPLEDSSLALDPGL
mmetsp:Transcript_25661/g.73272  ORF Transcript_25661/g.73272 Transcript_25661/m.73272 type:complete len:293 (-) Transcript_25661:383-1261(-)